MEGNVGDIFAYGLMALVVLMAALCLYVVDRNRRG